MWPLHALAPRARVASLRTAALRPARWTHMAACAAVPAAPLDDRSLVAPLPSPFISSSPLPAERPPLAAVSNAAGASRVFDALKELKQEWLALTKDASRQRLALKDAGRQRLPGLGTDRCLVALRDLLQAVLEEQRDLQWHEWNQVLRTLRHMRDVRAFELALPALAAIRAQAVRDAARPPPVFVVCALLDCLSRALAVGASPASVASTPQLSALAAAALPDYATARELREAALAEWALRNFHGDAVRAEMAWETVQRAYERVRQPEKAAQLALAAAVQSRPKVRESVARLELLWQQLREARGSGVVTELQAAWREIVSQPAQRMHAAVTLLMLRIWAEQRRVRDMMEALDDALAAEASLPKQAAAVFVTPAACTVLFDTLAGRADLGEHLQYAVRWYRRMVRREQRSLQHLNALQRDGQAHDEAEHRVRQLMLRFETHEAYLRLLGAAAARSTDDALPNATGDSSADSVASHATLPLVELLREAWAALRLGGPDPPTGSGLQRMGVRVLKAMAQLPHVDFSFAQSVAREAGRTEEVSCALLACCIADGNVAEAQAELETWRSPTPLMHATLLCVYLRSGRHEDIEHVESEYARLTGDESATAPWQSPPAESAGAGAGAAGTADSSAAHPPTAPPRVRLSKVEFGLLLHTARRFQLPHEVVRRWERRAWAAGYFPERAKAAKRHERRHGGHSRWHPGPRGAEGGGFGRAAC